ncbi:PadR family transcriptional regulator [bacterium]|nr:PadR family transcriptional regulator [bacterium]
MATEENGAPARRPPDLRPEFVALGLLAEGPAHGYELFRRFKVSLGGLWRISESQFYATLKRIEARGLAHSAGAAQAGGANGPRVLSLTPEGRALFEAWLAEPTAPSSRLIHLEFLARLHFLARLGPEAAASAAEAQARALAGDIARLEAATPISSTAEPCASAQPAASGADPATGALSAAFRLSQLRAALAWIEESVLPAVAAAFSGSNRA